MYCSRSDDRSSVRMKMTFGCNECWCSAVRASGATEAAAIDAIRSVRAARRKTRLRVETPQLIVSTVVEGNMRRSKLTSSLVALAASTTLFAGIAFAQDFNGTNHWDRIKGTPEGDTIDAKGGPDLVRAHAGNDTVLLGAGRDVAWLGDGDDSAKGGDGADWIMGGAGNDNIEGDQGPDK